MCVGNPAEWFAAADQEIGSLCDREGTVSLLQLRPEPAFDQAPALIWITACVKHQRAVRTWMRETWPHDDVDTYGTSFLVTVQPMIERDMGDIPMWRLETGAVAV